MTPPLTAEAAAAAPVSLAQRFGDVVEEIQLAAYEAKSIAGLLEMLSEAGYSNAHAADDYWGKIWWSQATYLSTALERLAKGLQCHSEDANLLVRELKGG